MKTQASYKKLLVLFDEVNQENIAVFDITSLENVKDYEYYYFGGYKYYIEYLKRAGAVQVSIDNLEQTIQTSWKIINIREVLKKHTEESETADLYENWIYDGWVYTSHSPKLHSVKQLDR